MNNPQVFRLNALVHALQLTNSAIDHAQRQSGRTEFDIALVTDDDCIVCTTFERPQIEDEIRRAGKRTRILTNKPKTFLQDPYSGTYGKRSIFLTHNFMKALIDHELDVVGHRLSNLLLELQVPSEKPQPVSTKSVQPSFHGGNGHFF
ncbi:MAG: hypothetical protein RIA09_15955 [Hoeflea sp.]|jgi:hypothetical protein|uniref:hypothetical protein n=1 Tax=Hoeflea sp. TaxID=1940281 RepID=UPI0032EE09C1